MKQKVVALAGGTGSGKLLRGLARTGCDLTVVANVGDNIWMHGLYVCPDVDIAMYTLAGVADRDRGWGLKGDTRTTMRQLTRLGKPDWFILGDMDIATHIVRTELLREGFSLTEVTRVLCNKFGVNQVLLPATDADVETYLRTSSGSMHLQEFWVKNRGAVEVEGVEYRGASRARPTSEVLEAIGAADRIVICPANPVTSVGPMLALRGFERAIHDSPARVVALSPMKGSGPYSGPAGKLLRTVGVRTDSAGVAVRYSRFLDAIIIDLADAVLSGTITKAGIKCILSDTSLGSSSAEKRLAMELLRA